MRHVSPRVTALLVDPVIPRINDGPQLCHWCQRKTMLAGGFNMLLTDELAHASRKSKGLVWRQSPVDLGNCSESDAWYAFRRLRWNRTNGEPVCPKCGSERAYFFPDRLRWKCKNSDCYHQYTVTSGTPFNGRKMDFRTLMRGLSSLHLTASDLSRSLNIGYRVARVFKFKATAFLRDEGFPSASFAGDAVKHFLSRRSSPIRAIHPDGSTKDYVRISDVASDGFRPSNVSQCIAGKKDTHKGVKWKRL